jgi:hypothetical protein
MYVLRSVRSVAYRVGESPTLESGSLPRNRARTAPPRVFEHILHMVPCRGRWVKAIMGATAGTPDWWAVFNLALIGGRSREFGLFRAGRQGRDGNAEASPSGSPAQPGEVVGAGSAPATPMTTATRRGTDDSSTRTSARCETPPTRAGARITDSPRTILMAVYLPHPVREGSGRSAVRARCGARGTGGPAAGTLTGSTPATALVRAHYPGLYPGRAPRYRRVTPPERFRVRWCG